MAKIAQKFNLGFIINQDSFYLVIDLRMGDPEEQQRQRINNVLKVLAELDIPFENISMQFGTTERFATAKLVLPETGLKHKAVEEIEKRLSVLLPKDLSEEKPTSVIRKTQTGFDHSLRINFIPRIHFSISLTFSSLKAFKNFASQETQEVIQRSAYLLVMGKWKCQLLIPVGVASKIMEPLLKENNYVKDTPLTDYALGKIQKKEFTHAFFSQSSAENNNKMRTILKILLQNFVETPGITLEKLTAEEQKIIQSSKGLKKSVLKTMDFFKTYKGESEKELKKLLPNDLVNVILKYLRMYHDESSPSHRASTTSRVSP